MTSRRSGLRFDKVAKRFVLDIRRGLRGLVPEGRTLIFTVSAPIRQASKTAEELKARLRERLSRARAKTDLDEVIHGNRIRARLVSARSSVKVIGYVHNSDVDTDALLQLPRSLHGHDAG